MKGIWEMIFQANVVFTDKVKENTDNKRLKQLLNEILQLLPSEDLKSITNENNEEKAE